MSHSLPRINFKRGFAQQNFSLHAFLQATYPAVKKQQIKPNKAGQDKANQPTNQPTKLTTKLSNNQTINKSPARKQNNPTSNHPTNQQNKFNKPHQTKTNQTKPNQNKTRKKQTKQINQPTKQPSNPPTQPNKQTARQTKQKTKEPHNEDDPCRNHRIFHMGIKNSICQILNEPNAALATSNFTYSWTTRLAQIQCHLPCTKILFFSSAGARDR